jgi:hypothetical protein
MITTFRTLILVLTLGFFAASAANACDGDKAACKNPKGTKTAMKDCSKCMKDGKCTMTKAQMKKEGCCMKDGKAMTMKSSAKAGHCDGAASAGAATGKHDCCKAKTGADKS